MSFGVRQSNMTGTVVIRTFWPLLSDVLVPSSSRRTLAEGTLNFLEPLVVNRM